ncbi:tetratricopeptide repeat protein [Streptomyces buecherae]|uniref:Tetratricopeptide repeat protein n=2 Tax=Streptomyces buecherae TaxID=2763006 RepID=A0A7H8NJ97_9ACTN|nr:tetratricopeptide repeat protein [Streptomyces buecherae]
MVERAPNEKLRRLFHETEWTLRQFAQQANRVGTERGAPRRYSAQTVWTWLQGAVPREPESRSLIVETLARRLGRALTLADAGFPQPEDSAHKRTGSDVVGDLVELGRVHVDSSRRRVVGVGLFSVALAIPGWSDVIGRAQALQSNPHARIGQAEVDSVREMVTRLKHIDGDFGGQYARPIAATFLVDTVAPYLRASATGHIRKAMLSAAAMTCYLAGWTAVDEGLNGLAQRYYVKGLELAGAADDHMAYCHILRGVSVQAANLGYGVPAARYANAAAEAVPSAEPRLRAFMAGQQAHGYALSRARTEALDSLFETERAMSRATSPASNTPGGYNASTLAYHTAQVRYALGDVKGSVASLREHFKLRDALDSRRSAVIFGGLMAERQLEVGHLDEACGTWSDVLDAYPTLYSGRADDRVRAAVELLAPHRKNATARVTHERARALLAQKSAARPSV